MPTRSNQWKSRAAIFLISQMVSIFGSSVVGYAVIWYITLETSSSSLMGISIICSFVPQIIISLFAGVWADRYSRKVIIILSDLFTAVSTLVLAVLFLSGFRSLTMIFIITALRSLGGGVQSPAVSSILPQIVPTDKLTKVNGLNNALSSVLQLLSPATGGVLLATFGFGATMFIDVISALLAVCIMLFLKVEHQPRELSGQSSLNQLVQGFRYTSTHPLLRRLLILFAVYFFMVTPAAFLTPVMIARSFGDEVWRLTANEMVWTAGSLLGGLIISVWGGFKNRLATFMLSCAGFGVTFALLGLVSNFYVYLAVMFISGIFMPIAATTETVLIQETVPEEMLGRVFSIVQIIITAAMPLGMLLFGPLGDIVPIEWLLIISGGILVVISPFALLCSRPEKTSKG